MTIDFNADKASELAGMLYRTSEYVRGMNDLESEPNLEDIPETAGINRTLRDMAESINANRRIYADWLDNYGQRMQKAATKVREFDEGLTSQVQDEANAMVNYFIGSTHDGSAGPAAQGDSNAGAGSSSPSSGQGYRPLTN